jgi:hypothetical protein
MFLAIAKFLSVVLLKRLLTHFGVSLRRPGLMIGLIIAVMRFWRGNKASYTQFDF